MQREAIVLAYWGGLTADEIARRCNVPLGTAKSRIRLGLAKLRREFEAQPRAGRSPPSGSLRRAVPVNGSQFDPRLLPVFLDGREALGQADWFDAHTHIGQNDPDGRKATPEEILGGLDAAGHQRALLFAMHEPDGYPAANDAVLAAAAASDGRLRPLARIAPNADGALAEARRCLDAGRARLQAAPALGRLRPAASGRRGGRRAGPRAPRARCSSTPAAGSRTSARPSSTSRAAIRARG